MSDEAKKARDERLERRVVAALIVPLVMLIPLWFLDHSVARRTRFIEGTVVTFETVGRNSTSLYRVTVDVDGEGVVTAKNPLKIITAVGARVKLLEMTGLLTGVSRYQLQQVVKLNPER